MNESESKKYIDNLFGNLDWEKIWEYVEVQTVYKRNEDDSPDGYLQTIISIDGDLHITTYPDPAEPFRRALRFRECSGGGGQSSRVRKALLLLCMAIKADNEGGEVG